MKKWMTITLIMLCLLSIGSCKKEDSMIDVLKNTEVNFTSDAGGGCYPGLVQVKEIRRILKPDGHIIVTTPNVAGSHAVFAGDSWRSLIPDHIYLFSQRTLRKLLEHTGYGVVKQVSWGGIPAGRRAGWLKKPADRLAKLFNVGDVMLFHCILQKDGERDG